MRLLKNTCAVLAFAALLFGQFGCSTTKELMSSIQFDQSALNTDKKIKTDSLALLDRAKDRAPYSGVSADVDQLMQKIDKAITSEQARTKNVPTVEQWKAIKAQLTKLFDQWKTKGSFSPAFVDQYKTQVTELFDTLIKTEEDKQKSTAPKP
jgi:hypothetical protein